MKYDREKLYPKIVALWNKGLPTREMGAELGLTKNAVCGLLNRMRDAGVKFDNSNRRPARQPTKKPAVAKTPPNVISLPVVTTAQKADKEPKDVKGIQQVLPFPEIVPKLVEPPPPPKAAQKQGIKFIQLRSMSCRYVVSGKEPEDFLFCGDQKVRGAYCAEHAALCYAPLNASKSGSRFKLAPMNQK